jgi:hypothetical protein
MATLGEDGLHAEGREGRMHAVVIPDGDAAHREDNIGGGEGGAQAAHDGFVAVGGAREHEGDGPRFADVSRERIGVGVHDGARLSGRIHGAEFVARGHDGHTRAAEYAHVADALRGEQADFAGADALMGGKDGLAPGRVAGGLADVFARRGGGVELGFIAVAGHVLLHDPLRWPRREPPRR